jgi:hypothetical protein
VPYIDYIERHLLGTEPEQQAPGLHQTEPDDDWQAAATFEQDLERFLSAWYGPPARPRTPARPSLLPPALAAWHRQADRWDEPITSLNRILGEHEVWLDGDVLVIYVERDRTWLWGVLGGPSSGHDPVVLERENTPDGAWTVTGERLGDFLLHVAVLEAILGAPAGVALDDATPDQLHALTWEMAAVRVSPWRWPGPQHTLWQRGRALALGCVNRLPDSAVTPDCTWWVVIGAREATDLAFTRNLGITFDNDTHPG